ncbi:MAG: tetratricopeptide (TPR) repeat protein [Pseudohongiellaceae bacterium]
MVGRAEGWNRLATLERQAGRPDQDIAAWRLAWSELPASNEDNWTQETVNTIFAARAGLDDDSKAFAMEIAEAALSSDQAAEASEKAAGVVLAEDGKAAANRRRAMLRDILAFAHIINGDVDTAVSLAERALALDPENGEYQQRAAFFLAGV